MITTTVNLDDLYNISDTDMVKMIFSSGDYFPGFYRFTLGTQKVGDESLSLNTLIWLYLEQQVTNNQHSKEDWLDLQHEIHDRDVASDEARNARNFPEVRTLFEKKMMEWYFEAKGFDILYMDIEVKVTRFEEDKCYYFMGSIIQYSNGKLNIGYNSITKEAAFSYPVAFDIIQSYLKDTFSTQQITDLFLEADIVATLTFDKSDEGVLHMNEKEIDPLLLRHSETKVFGSPFESRALPMRYAKSIRFTNFTRGNDGKFQVWQSDQNW